MFLYTKVTPDLIKENDRDVFIEQLAIHSLITELNQDIPFVLIESLEISRDTYKINFKDNDIRHFSINPREDCARSYFQKLLSIIELCERLGIKPKIAGRRIFESHNHSIILNPFNYDLDMRSDENVGPVDSVHYIEPENMETGFYSETGPWQLGVILYIMTAKRLPFGQGRFPIDNIRAYNYGVDHIMNYSEELRDLFAAIFCDKACRITMEGIRSHPWFVKNLPVDLNYNHIQPFDPAVINRRKIVLYDIIDRYSQNDDGLTTTIRYI